MYLNTQDLKKDNGYFVPNSQGGMHVTTISTNTRGRSLGVNKVGSSSKGYLKSFINDKRRSNENTTNNK